MEGHELYVGRLAIPYLTPSGVSSIKFRCMEPHVCDDHRHGKYEGLAGHDPRLFNVLVLANGAKERLLVCEGELDTIAASQAGYLAVGFAGTGCWESWFPRALEGWTHLYVMADGDEPGRKASKMVAAEVGGVVVPMPDGEDVASTLLKQPDWLAAKVGPPEQPEEWE
jgi:hypothetical protein